MGSSISPILVEILLDKLLNDAIAQVRRELNVIIRICKKYVDDLFLIIPRDKIDRILQKFNSQEERIQFTYEIESNGRLLFLDVIRNETTRMFQTDWYRKSISSGRILSYQCYT